MPQDLKATHPEFKNISPAALDLLQKCLSMDATQRPTAAECMKHKYFDGVWDESDLLIYQGKPIKLFFENRDLTKQLLELGFLNEISKMHPEVVPEVERRAAEMGIPMSEIQ